MKRFTRAVLGLGAAGALVLAGLGSTASATTAEQDVRAPQVAIRHVGDPLQYGGAVVTLAIRCFGGAVVQELTVGITQGEVVGRSSDYRDGPICDGIRRDVLIAPYSDSGEDFVAGTAMVTARLSVIDPRTMKPIPPVISTQRVYLRPFVVVTVAKGPVRLNTDGSANVSASVKCLAPYELSSFYVVASQNGERIRGSGQGDEENPPCDGMFHENTFTITANKPFTPGKILVTAQGYVLDPDTGDPVDMASADRKRQAVRSGS